MLKPTRLTLFACFALASSSCSVGERSSGATPSLDDARARAVQETLKPKIRDRHNQRRMVERDENGNIPRDALMRAKGEMASIHTEAIAAGFDSDKWNEAGPGNIGGRIRAIVIHPTSTNTIFVGSVSGGIWKTTDGGKKWARVDDKMGNLAISSMLMDPTDSKTMYAGTGEGLGADRRGAGIFKSTNSGVTWTRLASTNNTAFNTVNRLSMTTDGKVLLAATASGVFRSTNGGTSWTRTTPNSTDFFAFDVRFHPTKNNIAVAARRDYDNTNNTWISGVIYSTNGGSSWSEATGLKMNALLRMELAWHGGYTGTGNGCVYVQSNNSNTTLFRSIDGGKSFTQVSTNTGILGSQGDYDNTIWVDPTDTDANVNDDVVLAGGIDMYRSADGGKTFTKISDWRSSVSAHADHHAIVPHPGFNGSTNKTVFFGNDGGIYRADDVYTVANLKGWTNLNASLAITQFYGASRSATGDILYGGTQDNGTLTATTAKGFNGWTEAFGGDGGFSASDPTNSRYHYGEYVYGQVHRSSNSGAWAEDIWGRGQKAPYIITEAQSESGLFIAPFVLDPHNNQRLLVGLHSLWQTKNSRAAVTQTTGPTWTTIKPPVVRDQETHSISAITVDASSKDVTWVGHVNGDIYVSINSNATTPTWTRKDGTTLPNRYVTRIVVDPKDSKHIYALFGGFTANNIWESTNSGNSWTALTATPRMPVRDLEIHPNNPDWLYVAAEVGLLVSQDKGKTWSSAASPSDVPIDEMFWSGNRLYLATHGRGIFWQAQTFGNVTAKGSSCQTGTGNSSTLKLAGTAPSLGRTATVTVTNAPTGSIARLYAGVESGTPVKFLNCNLYINPLSLLPVGPLQFTGTTGVLSAKVPNRVTLLGLNLALQAAVDTSGVLYLTNGLLVKLGY